MPQRDRKQTRTLFIFYLLAVYVVIQFIWWAYYLVDLNDQILNLKLNGAQLQDSQVDLGLKHSKKMWMILGEGAVFITFLSIGIWKVQSNLKKEFKLARLQQNFLLSVTHEIKSPIASLRLYLETLLKRRLDEKPRKEILENGIKDTYRLDALTDKILIATRLETGAEVFNDERVSLREVAEDCVESVKYSIGKEFQFKLMAQEDPIIIGDREAIRSLVNNLLENAIKYSAAGSLITIEVEERSKKANLSVADEGIGIPSSERERVFEKFYRVGNEDTRTTKGTGLGLFIVKELATMLNAEVRIAQNKPKGSIFTLSFNKVDNE
jgi:signal transduction histidine kinase